MKKINFLLIVLGFALIFFAYQFFAGSSFEKKLYTSTQAVSNLEIIDRNTPVTITAVDANQPLTITYYENKANTYTLEKVDNQLTVTKQKPKYWWFHFSWVHFNKNTEIIAQVPTNQLQSLNVQTSNGPIAVDGLELTDATFKSSNGKIMLQDLKASQTISSQTSNGKLTLRNIQADKIESHTSNGKIELADLAFSTGTFETSNGKVAFDKLDATDSLNLKSSNGKITGSLVGNQKDFKIKAKTSNGKNNLVDSMNGEKELNIRTSNGTIDVQFTEE